MLCFIFPLQPSLLPRSHLGGGTGRCCHHKATACPLCSEDPEGPIHAHCPACPRAVPLPRWPWLGAGAPWPGTLVPPKGGPSPVSQDRALPSLLEETLRCWQVENKSVSNHKTSPKPVRNPKCRSGLEEDGGPCWGHHQSRGSRRAVGVTHGGVVTHGGG